MPAIIKQVCRLQKGALAAAEASQCTHAGATGWQPYVADRSTRWCLSIQQVPGTTFRAPQGCAAEVGAQAVVYRLHAHGVVMHACCVQASQPWFAGMVHA